ncbi:MAG TPA: phosphate signaling complex protein PhoU, partial [Candidatus Acidoferrales bacterium]|nr:phosphate signaling complex protein PhoU [Candidatus Acidoferrales bacterium]
RSRAGLDRDERIVKDGILRMGSLVEAQIRTSLRAITARDAGLAAETIAADEGVNQAQHQINEAVTMTIATQQPVARDLRFLLALNHVAYELERIGDHATSLAKQARRMAGEPPLPGAAELERMGSLAADLVRGILEALVDVDDVRARSVAARDDEIDHLYRDVFSRVVAAMRADPDAVEQGTRVILAAHWIERIGDRVTNIAEDVVYLASGSIEDLN